ncbi:hypothetical protein TNCV_3853311 [Trichonephila clavipes]|nr:hypothetical protein TNCV_3853311 [Trichonephila clavipes]
MTIVKIWIRCIQEGNTECHARYQRPPFNSSRETRHVASKNLMDHAATSRDQSQELRSFSRQHVSSQAVRRRFLQHGLSARRP